MTATVNSQLIALRQMSPLKLREKYLELFGEPSRSGNKDFLCKRLAWRIQSLSEGGLSERAKQRAAELARDADIRMTIPRSTVRAPAADQQVVFTKISCNHRLPIPGTILTRQYLGKLVQVVILQKGFEWEGQQYRSLSAVAKAVTGTHWNGYLFFGLKDVNKT